MCTHGYGFGLVTGSLSWCLKKHADPCTVDPLGPAVLSISVSTMQSRMLKDGDRTTGPIGFPSGVFFQVWLAEAAGLRFVV